MSDATDRHITAITAGMNPVTGIDPTSPSFVLSLHVPSPKQTDARPRRGYWAARPSA